MKLRRKACESSGTRRSFPEFARTIPSFLHNSMVHVAMSMHKIREYERQDGHAVMLVPGMFCKPSVFNKLGLELQNRGVDVHLPRTFPKAFGFVNIGQVNRSVEHLLEDLEELSKICDKPITLVGYSLGGIISLAAVTEINKTHMDIKVDGVVTIASPVKGAKTARLLSPVIPACRDILPSSEVIAKARESLSEIKLTIVTGSDTLLDKCDQTEEGLPSMVLDGFQHMDFYGGNKNKISQAADAIVGVLQRK